MFLRSARAFFAASREHEGPALDSTNRGRTAGFGRLTVVLALLLLGAVAQAGTTGKLAGRVLDRQGQPLPGANVIIIGTTLGAAADGQGYYNILNIPPGSYRVQFSVIGYQTLVMTNVLITSNNTTTLNAALAEEALTGEEVVVVAKRPVVDVNLTSSVATVTTENLATLPVQDLNDVVNLQAGVVDGHFRGGRLGEVQYQINGVSVNNPYDNSSTLRIDRSLLQEVQVISGTFDAEYGQAMSGVVNAVLKSGSENYRWSGEAYLSDFVFASGPRRNVQDRLRPLAQQNYQLSVSGPAPLPKTYFIVSGRRYVSDGYVFGTRLFQPTDRADFEAKVFTPGGDGKEVPLEYTREWSGLVKLTNRALPGIELSYQAIGNWVDAKRYNFFFRLNPEGAATQRTASLVHGFDWTHTLSKSTYYNLSLRQNLFDYHDYRYADVFDPRYDAAGPAQGDVNFYLGSAVQGVDFTRFVQRTNSYVLKAALTSQVRRDHLLKFGAEVQYSDLKFGTPGHLVSPGGTLVVRHVNEPPDYPDPQKYHPISLAAYAQDQIEWNDLIVRAGARFEYFDARATLPSDLQNPANAIQGAPRSVPKPTSRKISLAPRLGVSYPITTTAALFFAYGHFYQFPGLGQIFANSNYQVLDELQAGGISYGVLGNPDIKPERTVQYEFGYKHAITEFLGLDFSVFYKDIRDLLGVEFVSTYAAAEYARLTNVDFGSVLGFTLSLDQRRLGPVSTMLDYTWQRAMGNSSDPRETATRAAAGEDPRPRQVPLNWDQRHTLNTTITLDQPRHYALSTVIRFGSGQPYTPEIGSGFGADLEANSGRKPAFVLVDLRAEKFFRLANLDCSVFGRVFNLLDARFSNGFVFSNTGSPDYSLNPVADRVTLANPQRYYPPRRIELGLTVNAGL
ncbi:MAG: TonB-dependent receptor [candidate division KSB1 bacterium]|nr:TonB-dependent receptor [candidate division KSB1 bacterium]MDZ7274325.1 TonB-dependent receptor [candidate division KSB1 bacterium]MDZ7287153.1 TonB-dependent receptor [candidate division KSB1 bacterium]MDZ7296922.1 TonB-dependent receptor [candidate division KSB1 bacterium]MDZ7347789.1 TonB-dependent receptor [candidate division KSB1 bacterium]